MKLDFTDMSLEEKASAKKDFVIRLGKRIHDIRESKNITQEQLSHLAGYYRTYVGHIENATKSPTVHTVWRLAQAMEVDLGELLKGL